MFASTPSTLRKLSFHLYFTHKIDNYKQREATSDFKWMWNGTCTPFRHSLNYTFQSHKKLKLQRKRTIELWTRLTSIHRHKNTCTHTHISEHRVAVIMCLIITGLKCYQIEQSSQTNLVIVAALIACVFVCMFDHAS